MIEDLRVVVSFLGAFSAFAVCATSHIGFSQRDRGPNGANRRVAFPRHWSPIERRVL